MTISILLAATAPAAGQDAPAPPPSRPISESVERVVERMEKERADPCLPARAEGRPCFPVTTTIGPVYSVRESLGLAVDEDKPAPNTPPTTSEMKDYRPGPRALVVPLVSFDPGCVAKGLLKSLKGKNDTYFLYRIRDAQGERVALYDRKLEARTFQGELAFLGKFEGECDALAAYRREDLKLAPKGPPVPRAR